MKSKINGEKQFQGKEDGDLTWFYIITTILATNGLKNTESVSGSALDTKYTLKMTVSIRGRKAHFYLWKWWFLALINKGFNVSRC